MKLRLTRAIAMTIATGALAPSAKASPAGAPPQPAAVTFDSPGVTDLSAARRWKLPAGRPVLPTAPLSADAAREILAAGTVQEDSPAQFQNAGAAGASGQEKALVAKEGGAVKRQGKDLVITPRSGAPLLFRSFEKPATAKAEGDSARCVYAGRWWKGALHRVLIDFGHDSPGSFLVSAETGKVAFVHEGGDFVVLAPDGERLALFNDLNAPITLLVASLPAAGAAPEVVCRVAGKGSAKLALKGWKDAGTVDFVLGLGAKGDEKIPLRLERTAGAWRLLAPDPGRMALPDGLGCFAGKPDGGI
jgi:hypothetical protein